MKNITLKRLIATGLLLIFGTSLVFGNYLFKQYHQYNNLLAKVKKVAESPKESKPIVMPVVNVAPTPEVAKKVTATPPKHTTSGKITGTTKANKDGSKTTLIGEGNVSSQEADRVKQSGSSAGTPFGIVFKDFTGNYASLESPLKNYWNSQLKWGSEINALYELDIKDAGNTGWAGTYSSSYTVDPQGRVSTYGWITLNVYYYKNSPYLVDNLQLVLSHEYGHHYTLYHKFIDWNLPPGTRFPDSYYSIRPLSKATTAVDYSLGWGNCEVEIIAEDYSYLYSGYGYHAMKNTYNYPSAATKTWLNNIAQGPTVDNPPTVTISAPVNGAIIAGSASFSASASDDKGVVKVGFYINNSLLAEDTTAPYSTTISTINYDNGSYTLKAIAYDVGQSTQSTVTISIDNDKTSPIAAIQAPNQNPYLWSNGNLNIQGTATDNVGVTRIEVYIDNNLLDSQNSSAISTVWQNSSPWATPGDHILKLKAYDAAGNIGEISIIVTKT